MGDVGRRGAVGRGAADQVEQLGARVHLLQNRAHHLEALASGAHSERGGVAAAVLAGLAEEVVDEAVVDLEVVGHHLILAPLERRAPLRAARRKRHPFAVAVAVADGLVPRVLFVYSWKCDRSFVVWWYVRLKEIGAHTAPLAHTRW